MKQLVLPLSERKFRTEEYMLSPRSLERESVKAPINECTVVNVSIFDLNVVIVRTTKGNERFVNINDLLYPLNDELYVTCVLYNDKLYHTVLHSSILDHIHLR